MSFQQTSLWKRAFSNETQTEDQTHRDRLRTQLLAMRERVSHLLSMIPTDCRNLTVHDITHVDALWESADLLIGADYCLNPAETFVLGAAFLIHDAGLTTLAYPTGIDGLKASTLWNDLSTSVSDVSQDAILFEVLRTLHAEQAEGLCSRQWESASGAIFLLEDSELREAYGELIGRIAGSHHWSHERMQSDLSLVRGGSPSLPREWTINETKLACILRCADAAQVDRTRAPLMLYAALGPSGYSDLHWRAQSKLNRPALVKEAICFSSSTSFSHDEAEAWWVAYDLGRLLDRELRGTNALLSEAGLETFAALRVQGVDTPNLFAQHVKTNRWRPIDASIRVTDPMHIANTLGGSKLYGKNKAVAFRELVQNAADAVRARRAIEGRGLEYGLIDITVEEHPSSSDLCLIHIDDNGTGMSERVLSTTLVDFGKSIWKSRVLIEEFPSLKSKRVPHIGKFGIGFFSVFEVSQDVCVISRKYSSGLSDVNRLEFRGLVGRPLLRVGSSGDLPVDISTRITLSVQKTIVANLSNKVVEDVLYPWMEREFPAKSLRDVLVGMVSFLNVKVRYRDLRNGDRFDHEPNVYECSAEKLVDELFSGVPDRSCKFFDGIASLEMLRDNVGDCFGRAALDIDAVLSSERVNRGFVSVNGIVGSFRGSGLKTSTGKRVPFFGVVDGDVLTASRDVFELTVPVSVVDDWFDEQIKSLNKDVLKASELMRIAAFAVGATRREFHLPFAFHRGELRTAAEVVDLLKGLGYVCFPLRWDYDTIVEIKSYDSLRPDFFNTPLIEELFVLGGGSRRIFDDEKARECRKSGTIPLDADSISSVWPMYGPFSQLLLEAWKVEPSAKVTGMQIFQTAVTSLSGSSWVLQLSR